MNRVEWINLLNMSLQLTSLSPIEELSSDTKLNALAKALHLRFHDNYIKSIESYLDGSFACYMSLEYLIGKSLKSHVNCLEKEEQLLLEELVEEYYNVSLCELERVEKDAGLGNGGLGRLAACFMDSAATENLPLFGYGLRYEKGIFSQSFEDGFQVEEGDNWLEDLDPWGYRNEDDLVEIELEGTLVNAVPYDYMVPGYNTDNINRLRLWKAEAKKDFDFQSFNNFEYDKALSNRNRVEDITRVLYPNDESREGVLLRFKQQYFFASATIYDLVRLGKKKHQPMDEWFKKIKIQLNDTHPVIAIVELVRILVEEEAMDFHDAIDLVRNTFNYTNHTIMKEAMEQWPTDIVQQVSTRLWVYLERIDKYFVQEMEHNSLTAEEIDSMRILKNGRVYMAPLGIHSSKKVNGVAKLHSSILKERELKDFAKYYPNEFTNITNGVSPRKFLMLANPKLAQFIDKYIGESWRTDLTQLSRLKPLAEDTTVLKEFADIKKANKKRLAKQLEAKENIRVNPDAIFDIQIKRIHEYKRQLMNAFHIYYLYCQLKENPHMDFTSRVFIFGGKAAPGYFRAKAIIKYINELAKLINNDPDMKGRLQVVFIENYNVTWAESLVSACDVSEQISTAGKEASGTGNMKFMMNGTITLGTMDGANVEIFEEAGKENNYIFGASVEELNKVDYNPKKLYETNPTIKKVVDSLMDSRISDNDTFMFLELFRGLVGDEYADPYFILYDLEDYISVQDKIGKDFRDEHQWIKKSFLNMAASGKFSSDRTILEYANDIWEIEPKKINI